MDTLQATEKLNVLIEKERASKQNIHRTIVFDYKHMTSEEFLALSQIIIKNLVPAPVFSVPNQFAEFQKAAIQGEIDILKMTKRQQMYFLIFLQDQNFKAKPSGLPLMPKKNYLQCANFFLIWFLFWKIWIWKTKKSSIKQKHL